MHSIDSETEKLIQQRVRLMLEPIARSAAQGEGTFDPGVGRESQAAALDVAVVLISNIIMATDALRTIARVLEAEHERDNVDGARG